MANRHLSRSVVLQALFEWDFKGYNNDTLTEVLERISDEFAPGLDDTPFMQYLLDLVAKKKEIIDAVISKAAPEWPVEKINTVDRNILRLGLAELLFGDYNQVPPKVALNEAIELGKTFGGENSSRFINGVLGAVYKEIGEPGKEQKSKRQIREADIDPATLPVDQKAAAVVYAIHKEEIYLAFVHDIFGYWTLSKGGVEEGETAEEAVARELKEEINIDIVVKEKLGENEYIATHPERGKIRKHVTYFLGEAKYTPITLESSGGLDDAQWFKLAEISDLHMYDDITKFTAKAISIITNNK
ncbi:MAG: transcription antitermination factor NusB [Candidatus Pacebacteria bacterium]|nr:transcription antitermination factor NusB [Candidatus Paceibacterota bacterium]